MDKTQRLAHIVDRLFDDKQKVHEEAEVIIGKYWVRWKLKNRQIIEARVSGDNRLVVGKVAPTLRVHKEPPKTSYIRWRFYDDPFIQMNIKQKGAKKFAKDFAKGANGIARLDSLLAKAEKWEQPLIEETYHQLYPLAREMSAINEAIKKINVAIRAIEKLNN